MVPTIEISGNTYYLDGEPHDVEVVEPTLNDPPDNPEFTQEPPSKDTPTSA